MENVAAVRDLTVAFPRVLGWDKGQTSVTVHSEKTVIVCDEGRRTELIAQRQRLLKAKEPVPGRTVELTSSLKRLGQKTLASLEIEVLRVTLNLFC